MEYTVTVVGIGPGSPDYMLPAAVKAIRSAKVLVGSQRALSTLAPADAVCKVIDKDIDGVLQFIRERLKTENIVVMVSGDPGFYSLLPALKAAFEPSVLRVIPGISSVQLAFARIGDFWQDAVLISLHGRPWKAEKMQYQPDRKLAILTDGINRAQTIAARLLAEGWPAQTTVWLCRDLSYENETVLASTLEGTAGIAGFEHCVMVVAS